MAVQVDIPAMRLLVTSKEQADLFIDVSRMFKTIGVTLITGRLVCLWKINAMRGKVGIQTITNDPENMDNPIAPSTGSVAAAFTARTNVA